MPACLLTLTVLAARNPLWQWIIFGACLVALLILLVKNARSKAWSGRFQRGELDAIVQRYLSSPGRQGKVGALCYRFSDDFESRPLPQGNIFLSLKNKALSMAIRAVPLESIPLPKPLSRLKETAELQPGLPDKTPKARILASTVKVRPLTTTVELDVEQGLWGRIRNVVFYGPDAIYTVDLICPGQVENYQALLPLIESFLDNLHFSEAALGEPFDDAALAATGMPVEGRPMVVKSPFPVADDSGHLLCKNCGMPFESSCEDAQEFYQVLVRRDQRLTLLCPKCNTVSVFLQAEVNMIGPTVAV